jgi:chromate reductase, NAD(P)H dehydrogenase (quinone)
MKPRILALSANSRTMSFSTRLLEVAVAGAESSGAEVTSISLSDYELPFYEADWEAEHGLPETVRSLQALVAEQHGLLIASPDLNGGYTAVLKNGIDWLSRPDDFFKERRPVFPGKIAAIVSSSSEPGGGLRAQLALVMVLHRLGVITVPDGYAFSCVSEPPDYEIGVPSNAVEAQARRVGSALAGVSCRLGDLRQL